MSIINTKTAYMPTSSFRSFFFEAKLGNVPGWTAGEFFSTRVLTSQTTAQNLWEGAAGQQPFLTSSTLLQVSSTDSSDTGIELTVPILDDNYASVAPLVGTLDATDAQTPVQIGSTAAFRHNGFFVSGPDSPSGTIYLSALGDNAPNGVPDNPLEIITLDPLFDDSNILANTPGAHSNNASRGSRFTVPLGHTMVINAIDVTAFEDNEELEFFGRVRGAGRNVWSNRYPLPAIGGFTTNAVNGDDFIVLPERADLAYWGVKLSGNNSRGIIKTSYYLRDNNVV